MHIISPEEFEAKWLELGFEYDKPSADLYGEPVELDPEKGTVSFSK